MTVSVGDQVVDQFTIEPKQELIRKPTITAAQLGSGDVVDVKISVDKTYVPAVITRGANRDPRELGVRVFHAYVQTIDLTCGTCSRSSPCSSRRQRRPSCFSFPSKGRCQWQGTASRGIASSSSLRGGGEMTFDRALVMRIAPDEVEYPVETSDSDPHRQQ